MKSRLHIGVSAAAWLLATTATGFAGQVSCDGFALGYDGSAEKKTCLDENTSTGDMTSEMKELRVHDHGSYLAVAYETTGTRTYLPFHSPRELLHVSSFTDVQTWGPSRKIGEFDTIAFTGAPAGHDVQLACALFVRYSGNPGNHELNGGPGAKDAVRGVYCATPASLTPAQQKDGFYSVVEQVLGKLTIPPTQ